MNITHLRRVRRLFSHPDVARHTARHNMRAWVTSMRFLGGAWILSKTVPRRTL